MHEPQCDNAINKWLLPQKHLRPNVAETVPIDIPRAA